MLSTEQLRVKPCASKNQVFEIQSRLTQICLLLIEGESLDIVNSSKNGQKEEQAFITDFVKGNK